MITLGVILILLGICGILDGLLELLLSLFWGFVILMIVFFLFSSCASMFM